MLFLTQIAPQMVMKLMRWCCDQYHHNPRFSHTEALSANVQSLLSTEFGLDVASCENGPLLISEATTYVQVLVGLLDIINIGDGLALYKHFNAVSDFWIPLKNNPSAATAFLRVEEPPQKRQKTSHNTQESQEKYFPVNYVLEELGVLVELFPEANGIQQKFWEVMENLILSPPIVSNPTHDVWYNRYLPGETIGVLSNMGYSPKFQAALYGFYVNEILTRYGSHYATLRPHFERIQKFEELRSLLLQERPLLVGYPYDIDRILSSHLMQIEAQQRTITSLSLEERRARGREVNGLDARNVAQGLILQALYSALSANTTAETLALPQPEPDPQPQPVRGRQPLSNILFSPLVDLIPSGRKRALEYDDALDAIPPLPPLSEIQPEDFFDDKENNP